MLKLYVWEDFCSDWTPGLAFAIANSEEEAKQMVAESLGGTLYDYYDTWWDLRAGPDIYDLDSPMGFAVKGGG